MNRDIDRAREVTKDKEVYVDFYISPSAIDEIMSGGEGIRKGINSYAEQFAALTSAKEVEKTVLVDIKTLEESKEITPEQREQAEEATQKYKEAVASGVPQDKAQAQLKEELVEAVGESAASGLLDKAFTAVTSAKDKLSGAIQQGFEKYEDYLRSQGYSDQEIQTKLVDQINQTSYGAALSDMAAKYGGADHIPASELGGWLESFVPTIDFSALAKSEKSMHLLQMEGAKNKIRTNNDSFE